MISLNKLFALIIGNMCILIITGCSAVFEDDIENETVYLTAPPDSLHTSIATQTFWWNYVEGADFYNLQIVSPHFDYIERIVLDTNVAGDKFQFTLIPGTYEWRVNAYNSAYATPYTVNTLFIDSTLNLSLQQVILKNPPSNIATNYTRFKFHWEKIYSATLYHYELRQDDWNGNSIIGPVETSADTISFVIEEGSYVWGVKALNEISSSQFSTRKFMVDLTSPSTPVLQAPESGIILRSQPVQLVWERPDAGGSVISDSIYISADSVDFFVNIKETHKTTNTSFNIGFDDAGDYYWRIRSIDGAGNKSQFSSIRKFSIEVK